ncbi:MULTISPECIES: MarR family winged helix-turn-helix transcriptional regulator [Lactiplantibacillus]|uniref:MarR family transcriptional regulator n=1 Tax=Lactiplantibacillus pentosus TaxID=1589 RepID=A0AAW8WIN8_LACPE|nr:MULTISPECIES: MarR family transcriptional regulator [Lactiplantibacillus]MBU7460732.1 MarR family transcriptional regulator [Lactiplantibacillus pentosus]MBU7478590.1 MarR family transcriptional regulator [Lactiplantibacillus pentosus]MBU7483394.1 MarR family transcriptional regulator [Lactiplantibacillus sp. 30.2.29]MBU7509410.1 MarR family transcriptional regulator [Lactiplantibacillus pentosus]MBU7512721.1 MarR family transcriptional regulator [Lactiplantibacillus pentosus]
MATSAEQAILAQLKIIRTKRASTTGEQKWLKQHINEANLRRLLPDISIVGLHLLSALEAGPQTGIDLATTLGVTRGGITRAAKRLTSQGLIGSFQQPDDHKKIFYRLTPSGRKLAHYHDQMHAARNHEAVSMLREHYSLEELAVIQRFLLDLTGYED